MVPCKVQQLPLVPNEQTSIGGFPALSRLNAPGSHQKNSLPVLLLAHVYRSSGRLLHHSVFDQPSSQSSLQDPDLVLCHSTLYYVLRKLSVSFL